MVTKILFFAAALNIFFHLSIYLDDIFWLEMLFWEVNVVDNLKALRYRVGIFHFSREYFLAL